MRDRGFEFIRIPMAYPCYFNIDRTKNITPDYVYKINNEAVDDIDSLVQMAHKYNMHTSINLHRAPGYRVNEVLISHLIYGNMKLPKRFLFSWSMWAKRYKNNPVSS